MDKDEYLYRIGLIIESINDAQKELILVDKEPEPAERLNYFENAQYDLNQAANRCHAIINDLRAEVRFLSKGVRRD